MSVNLPLQFKSQHGFTLIELCIILIIMGIMIVPQLTYYKIQMQKESIKVTYENMAAIQAALAGFYERNNHYPCPSGTLDVTSNNYLRETECRKYDYVSGILVTNDKDGKVAIGRAPTRALGLADKYAKDGWGSDILYAVDLSKTADTGLPNFGYHKKNNVIKLLDSNAQPLTIEPVEFILMSSGINRQGYFSAEGKFSFCLKGSYEEENCDGDNVFIREIYSEASGPNYFDDIIINDQDVGVSSGKTVQQEIGKMLNCQSRGAFYSPYSDLADSSGCIIASIPRGICPTGQVISGINSKGQMVCTSNMHDGLCQGGQILVGYDSAGNMICNDILIKIQICAQNGMIYAGNGITGADAQGCIHPKTGS